MRENKSIDIIIKHKNEALSKLENLIDRFIDTDPSKADKFSYWLEDYSAFLDKESNFNPKSLIRYKRGSIIKAHLGFNIGSEEGGLHYCVVLDNNNDFGSPVVTVVPLTSMKYQGRQMRKGEVDIGDEIYTNLLTKFKKSYAEIGERISRLQESANAGIEPDKRAIMSANKDLGAVRQVQKELSKMKFGSIALVGQITTISKIRIVMPKTKHDPLSGIRISDKALDNIDKEICKLFLKKA